MLYDWDGLLFVWDDRKAPANLDKHRVGFQEAATVFGDPGAGIVFDEDHSVDEQRYFILGYSDRQRLLAVSYTERGDRIRLISAREATGPERRSHGHAR